MDVIGSGGMATVWRANDTRLGRQVALKRPHPAPAGSVTYTRFAREARAAATVNHHHLVAVYDTGEDDTGPYLVMELVDGPSLAQEPPRDGVAALGAQIASALAALHAAGVVHGDVKPANVLLADTGAKLTDFGIARTVDDTSALTQPGIALGTPAYAAPEIVAGSDRTASADVYSLASLLHELVTGSRWDPAAGSTQVMPTGMWRSVLGPALSTDPAARPTAAAFASGLADLDRLDDPFAATVPMVPVVAAAPVEPIVPKSDARRGGRAAVLIALVTVATLGIVALLASRNDDDLAAANVSALPSSSVADPAALSTVAPTVMAGDTTVPPSTATPETLPSTTAIPATVAAPTATDLANELVALIEGVSPDDLKPKEARDITKRIDEAMKAAAEDEMDDVEKALSEAAERIERDVENDDTRGRGLALLAALWSTLGADGAVTAERPD